MDNQQQPTLSIDSIPPPPPTLDLYAGSSAAIAPTPEVTDRRAYKASEGLSTFLDKSFSDIHSDIASGQEQDLRQQAASKLDAQNAFMRQQKIKDATLANQGPLTIDQVNSIIDPNNPSNRPVNPSSVIEQSYGNSVTSTLDQAHANLGTSILGQANRDVPDSTKAAKYKGSVISAIRERALTEAENIQDTTDHQGWLGWGWDTAKTFFQPYDELKLRGLVDGMYFQGGGLSSNLQAQANALIQKPMDQQNAFWDGPVWQKLKTDNPQLGQQFLSAFLGQSSSDRILGDLNTPMVIGDIKAMGALAGPLGRRIGLINQTREATRSVVEASMLPNPSKASMLEAAGDSQGAAAKQATSNLVSDLNGNVDLNQRALDAMPTAMRSDQAKIRAGSPGREIVNRLEEDTDSLSAALQNNAINSGKVSRNPEMLTEANITQLIKKQRENYPGPANSLGDSVGPHLDERSNTYWIEHQLRNEDASFFESPEQAQGWAKANGIVLETPKSYVESITNKIAELQEGVKTPPDMHADVNELNRHVDMQNQLESMTREKNAIDKRGLEGYSVKPVKNQGLGFYISYMQPLKETDSLARSFIAQTTEGKLQDTWLNGASRWGRTPAETLSILENRERVTATHAPSLLQKLFFEASEPIKKLPGQYVKDWSRAVDFARTAIDPVTKRNGHFFQDIGEMENWYRQYADKGRLPSDPEIRGYFAFKRNYEAERQLRITRAYSLKARIGTEQHSIYVNDAQGNRVQSDFFEGVRRTRDEPFGGEDTAFVPGKTAEEGQMLRANSPKLKAIRAKIKKGELQAIELFNPDDYPLSNFAGVGDARVRFVITKNFETKPLSYENQVNRAGGGHFVYDYDHYIKSPDMKFDPASEHWNYAGDKTVMPVANAKMGRDFVEHLNEVSRLMAEGKEAEAHAYHTEHELPMKWEDHKSWYEATKDETGRTKAPQLRKGEQFYVVPRNSLIVDMDKSLEKRYNSMDANNPDAFRDRTRKGSLARQSTVEFTGERDAENVHALDDIGTRGNPLYQHAPAKLVDPIPTYNRALARIINSSYMDDYKIHAVERWIAQAKDLLDVDDKDLAHSPFYYYANANENWKKSADKVRKASLQVAKFNIDQFVGTPSKVDQYINNIAQRLTESIYGAAGPGAAAKFTQVADMPYVRDPLSFVRGATFHLKMGLFSIPQFLMQLTTASNVMAIGGSKHLPSVLTAGLLHQWSRLNASPEILAHLDGLASKMSMPGFSRWKPGEWLEARKFIIDYLGFDTIGGEHAFRDTPWSAKIVQNLGHDILDWGETPFREGASNTRIVAAYMAYREFREGPMSGKGIIGALTGGKDTIFRRGSETGALSREDKASIASRAADLDHNMSRAANSAIHTGVLSPFGQFTAYSLRLTELMTGKRLTWQEKARLFGVSSILYGVPLGGLGLYGYPIGDYIRTKARDNGYQVGDNFIQSTLMEGLPSEIMKVVTGNNYNISRFGAKGFDPASELMNSDSTVWKIFGGAAFSTVGNWWAETSGIRNFAISSIRGDNEQFPITSDDIEGLFGLKEAASWSAATRLRYALNSGKWISKNGTELSSVSPTSAWFQTLSGTVNQKTADITIDSKALKAEKDANDNTEKQFEAFVNQATAAEKDNDPEQAKAYLMKAKAMMGPIGDYPQEKRALLWARALKPKDTLDNQLRFDYLMRNAPASKAGERQEIYLKENQINQNQKAQ